MIILLSNVLRYRIFAFKDCESYQMNTTNIKWFFGFPGHNNAQERLVQKLQQQRNLLISGVQVEAEVMGITHQGSPVCNLIEIMVQLRIHKTRGAITIVNSSTVVSTGNIPVTGQKLVIWFMPMDPTFFLIR